MSVAERLEQPGGDETGIRTSKFLRGVNERIRELTGPWQGENAFVCECEDARCTRVLRLTEAEYEALRSRPQQFAVLPGHQHSYEVVSRASRYVVVRERHAE